MDRKLKEGVSVKELEAFAKKHRLEVFFCLVFIFSCFFSFVFFGTGWSVFLLAIGAVLGVLIPQSTDTITRKTAHFIFKQERTTQLVLGVVCLAIAIFIPPAMFFLLGIHGGKSIHHQAMTVFASESQKK